MLRYSLCCFQDCGTGARVHADGYALDTEVGQQVLWIHEGDSSQNTISWTIGSRNLDKFDMFNPLERNGRRKAEKTAGTQGGKGGKRSICCHHPVASAHGVSVSPISIPTCNHLHLHCLADRRSFPALTVHTPSPEFKRHFTTPTSS